MDDYYGSSPGSDPRGPTTASYRVLRGGSWYHFARETRVSYRDFGRPDIDSRVGFRVVLSPGQYSIPGIAVEQPVGADIPNGGSRDFGSAFVGDKRSLTFTIENTGNGDLTGLTITRAGADAADFTVKASPVAPVAPDSSTTFEVEFAPTNSGSKTATIHIANNDAFENPFYITLTGTGLTAVEAWRLQYFGTTKNRGDAADEANPDGDLRDNRFEFLSGFSPLDAGDFFEFTEKGFSSPTTFDLNLNKVIPDRTYTIYSSTNLKNWSVETAFSVVSEELNRLVQVTIGTEREKFFYLEISE